MIRCQVVSGVKIQAEDQAFPINPGGDFSQSIPYAPHFRSNDNFADAKVEPGVGIFNIQHARIQDD